MVGSPEAEAAAAYVMREALERARFGTVLRNCSLRSNSTLATVQARRPLFDSVLSL